MSRSRPIAAPKSLTVSTSAVGFSGITGGIPAGADRALVKVETSAVRVGHGGDPTGTLGPAYEPGEEFQVTTSLEQFKAIRRSDATADATLQIIFYGA